MRTRWDGVRSAYSILMIFHHSPLRRQTNSKAFRHRHKRISFSMPPVFRECHVGSRFPSRELRRMGDKEQRFLSSCKLSGGILKVLKVLSDNDSPADILGARIPRQNRGGLFAHGAFFPGRLGAMNHEQKTFLNFSQFLN